MQCWSTDGNGCPLCMSGAYLLHHTGLGTGCCVVASAFVRGRTAFARACCGCWDGEYAAALEHCAAGLADLSSPGASSDSGCSENMAWHMADLGLQLQLQQAKCQAALVRIMLPRMLPDVTAS
jgi:hypothetical protein